MSKDDTEHKVATKNKGIIKRSGTNINKVQHCAENDEEETELLRSHMQDAR